MPHETVHFVRYSYGRSRAPHYVSFRLQARYTPGQEETLCEYVSSKTFPPSSALESGECSRANAVRPTNRAPARRVASMANSRNRRTSRRALRSSRATATGAASGSLYERAYNVSPDPRVMVGRLELRSDGRICERTCEDGQLARLRAMDALAGRGRRLKPGYEFEGGGMA